MRGTIKAMFVLALLGIVAYWGFIGMRISKGVPTYVITVRDYSSTETYVTSEYKIDSVTRCISFKDALGMSRTVCSNYSITNY